MVTRRDKGVYSLSTFYKSREWENIIEVIKMQRVQDDGLIYCEHCGGAIVRAYDCIGHHKTHLTDANVNDHTISLNPENIMLVHHRCHNKIHDKFGSVSRQIFLVYGPPLSGKSTWVSEVQRQGDLIIDMDSIWKCISGCERYIKPGRLNAVAFGLRDTLIEMVKHRCGKWNNAYVIGGYPLISERERICKMLGAREVYINTTQEECLERL